MLCAWLYPPLLAALWLTFYWVGESWWVTAAGLYVPRLPFAIPLPFLVVALWVGGARRWLWAQVLSACVALMALMGLVVWSPVGSRTGAQTLRVLSFNVNSERGGQPALGHAIFASSPDVVLLQEAAGSAAFLDALRLRYPYVQRSTQFIIASRFPITAATEPERVLFNGQRHLPRFVRYVLDTPIGSLAIYNIHPISPRGVLHVQHLRAALHQLRTGQLFAGDPEADVTSNFELRARQVETIARDAARETLPVLIAGDTNLPGLSTVFRENLGSYADAFKVASWGFGYTFPAKHPFLRLDRILASDKLRFVSFHAGCHGVSDHLCVVADFQARQ